MVVARLPTAAPPQAVPRENNFLRQPFLLLNVFLSESHCERLWAAALTILRLRRALTAQGAVLHCPDKSLSFKQKRGLNAAVPFYNQPKMRFIISA